MPRVTQSHIARKVGISKQAVAYALSSRPELTSKLGAETRQRVLDTARSLGYVPDRAARRLAQLRHRRTQAFEQVALIYVSPHSLDRDPICFAIMGGAEQGLSRLGAMLTFVRVSAAEEWSKVAKLARAGSIDACFLYGAEVNDEAIARVSETGLPYVILADHRCARPVFSVDVDNAAVGRLAVQHLAALGHRRIGYWHGMGLRFPYQKQILSGFQDEQKRLNLDDDDSLIWPADRVSSAERVRCGKTTAVFTAEFDFAAIVDGQLRQAGVEIPTELSLVAFEPAGQPSQVLNFTRIESPLVAVGRTGVELLHSVATAQHRHPVQVKVPPAIIEGWSTAPAPDVQSNRSPQVNSSEE